MKKTIHPLTDGQIRNRMLQGIVEWKPLRSATFLALLTVVLVSIQPLSAQVQGQWVGTGALQSARELSAQVLLANGKVLSMGGIDNNGNLLASVEVYTSGLGTWKLTGSMANAREEFPAVVLKSGKVSGFRWTRRQQHSVGCGGAVRSSDWNMVVGGFPFRASLCSYGDSAPKRQGVGGWRRRWRHRHGC